MLTKTVGRAALIKKKKKRGKIVAITALGKRENNQE